MFSWVLGQNFPLHFLLDYFQRLFEAEFFQQDLLVFSGLGNAAGTNFDTASSGKHDVHRADVGQLCKHAFFFRMPDRAN
jgi:hypothetical protein